MAAAQLKRDFSLEVTFRMIALVCDPREGRMREERMRRMPKILEGKKGDMSGEEGDGIGDKRGDIRGKERIDRSGEERRLK